MDGFLFKWTNYINGWQQRYFTLHDGILSYFASESDVDTGCKGALKVSACEVVVHQTDACRFEILIPGEQRFFLKAGNSVERQRWIIALGSCKAGITNVDELEKMQQTERAIKSKRSELRINRDLLVQQINAVSSALKLHIGKNEEMIETVRSLRATCDTLLSNADDLISLLLNSSRFRSSVVAANVELSPVNGRRPSAFPESLLNDKPKNSKIPSPDKGGELTPTTVALNRSSNNALLNTHLRALRMTRPYPTFFSSMEFSFEDLALPPSFVSSTSISAVEFLACCRSALTFFPSLANVISKTEHASVTSTGLAYIGSLQTVYADVLANVMCLELAVKSLVVGCEAEKKTAHIKELIEQRSLVISLADILDTEAREKRSVAGSAYLSMLWLARSLNFAAEFLNLLFKDTNTAFGGSIASKSYVEEIATKAYTDTLKYFHDPSLIESAMVILKSVPTAECIQSVLLRPARRGNSTSIAPSTEAMAQLQLDVERFVEALRCCLVFIHNLFRQRQLDPLFPPVSQALLITH